MNELIKIEERDGIQTVNARDLWLAVESNRKFADWIQDRLDGFVEGTDFIRFHNFVKGDENGHGNKTQIDYYLSIEMAKHIAMLERNEKGKSIRQYFIEAEKAWREQSKLALPKTYAEALRDLANEVEAREVAEKRLLEVQPKIEAHDALVSSDKTMSITDAAKHFNLHPRIYVFPFLREYGFLTQTDLPTQKALDLDVMVLRESINKITGETFKHAKVETRQLVRWNDYLIPAIMKYINND